MSFLLNNLKVGPMTNVMKVKLFEFDGGMCLHLAGSNYPPLLDYIAYIASVAMEVQLRTSKVIQFW